MKTIAIAALALCVLAAPVSAQQVPQQPSMSQQEIIDSLRSMVKTYQQLTAEANERVASFKAETVLVEAKAKALQSEIDKLKADAADKAKITNPKPAER